MFAAASENRSGRPRQLARGAALDERDRGRSSDEPGGRYSRCLHRRKRGGGRRLTPGRGLNRAHVGKDRQPIDRLLFESVRRLYRALDVILVH